MNPVLKWFYILTAYYPRRLPTTIKQYRKMNRVLEQAYGVPNAISAWHVVAGQITSTPADRIRKSWGHIANCAKRLEINGLAREFVTATTAELNKKINDAMEAESKIEEKNDEEAKAKLAETHAIETTNTPDSAQAEGVCVSNESIHEPIDELGIGNENPL